MEFLWITLRADDHVWNALLDSFLNRFCRKIARWKGLELRNPGSLQLITFGNALHLIPYKNKNIVKKSSLISWNIAFLHQVVYMYGKRRDRGSQWWQPKWKKTWYYFRKSSLKIIFYISPYGRPGSNSLNQKCCLDRD